MFGSLAYSLMHRSIYKPAMPLQLRFCSYRYMLYQKWLQNSLCYDYKLDLQWLHSILYIASHHYLAGAYSMQTTRRGVIKTNLHLKRIIGD